MATFDVDQVGFDPGPAASSPQPEMRSSCSAPSLFAMAGQGGLVRIYGRAQSPVLAMNKWPARMSQWTEIINAASNKHQIPACLIAAFMSIESGGVKDAKSPSGAIGLMQLMPSTFNWLMGRPKGSSVSFSEASEPELNVDLGANLLARLFKQSKGNLVAMAASYNAGKQRCGELQECKPSDWNLKVNCGYIDHVLGGYNAAIAAGFEDRPSAFVKPKLSSKILPALAVVSASVLAAFATNAVVQSSKRSKAA